MLFLLSGAVSSAQAADFIWNNGAATGLWNATDANWSGAAWENVPSNQAIFTSVGGTVVLGEPISAGAVTYGSTAFNGHSYQLQRCDGLSGPWQDIGPAQTGNDVPITFIDPAGITGNHCFYCVSVSP